MSDDTFVDLGMGPGVRAGGVSGAKLPEQMDQGVGAVYDRVRKAGGTHEQAEEAVRVSVYGPGYRKDRQGRPIGRGVGSPGNETIGHFQAIRKYSGEVRYQMALKEIWKRDPNQARRLGLEEPDRATGA